MRIRLRVVAAVAIALGLGLSLVRSRRATVASETTMVPYYDARDFTPRWSPVLHRVQSFHLIDQQGRPFSDKDLDGKIHVASFIFTSCPSVCPTLIQRLKPVQEALRNDKDVVMVSYSVTPLTDTPEVLAQFGQRRGIDPDRWHLATGDLNEVKGVLHNSYFADDPRPTDGNDGQTPSRLLHTEKVILVDGNRHLRGIYNGTHAFEMERLLEDIAALQAER